MRVSFLEIAGAAVALGYTALVVGYLLPRGYFYGDDYVSFLLARTDGFWPSLLVPMGGQVVPLARALNYAFFRIAGLDYHAALGVSCALELVGALYLYRTLNLVRRTALNALVVAAYTCYVHTWVQLGWWASGVERLPFVALGTIALYHYVRYRESRAPTDLAIAGFCTLAGLGFYSKALLVPLCMVGSDLARLSPTELRSRRNLVPWATALGLVVAAALCLLAEHHAAGALRAALFNATLAGTLEFSRLALLVHAHALAGLAMTTAGYHPRPFVAILALIVVGYTSYRAPRARIGWMVLLVLLLANFFFIGASNRVGTFGPLMALEPRYYWELCFFSYLLLGLILQQIPTDTKEALWLRRAPSAARGVSVAALIGYAGVSYRSVSATALPDSAPIPETRAFVTAVRANLSALSAGAKGRPLVLVDGDLPTYMVGFDLNLRKVSQLLSLLDVPVTFKPLAKADFLVLCNGRVARVPEQVRDHEQR